MAEHIQVPGTLTVDLSAPFTQQGILNLIRTAYPTSPDYTVVSIAVPLVHINCLEEPAIYDPIDMLKDAANKLYNYFMQYYVQPIWNALYSLYEALKGFGLAVLDLSIGILDLTISDLFSPDLYDKIKRKIMALYDSVTRTISQTLIDLLDFLGILIPKTPFSQPQFDIEYIINSIMSSLWAAILRLIKRVISLISTGLKLWEIATQQGRIVWSKIWDDFVDAILGGIIDFLTNVPTIQDIYDALVAYGRSVYNKLVLTAEELLAILKDFKFFGLKPFDWDLPWNPTVSFPEVDLKRMLNSMLVWFKNYLFSIINQFIQAVYNILQFFGINLSSLLTINIPITFCAIPNTKTA